MHVFELPSGTEVELREMTGAEEELLTNQRLIRTGEAVNQVLRNGIVRLGQTTRNRPSRTCSILLSGDRLFILLKLRQISLGDVVELELTCASPACGATNPVTIHIDDLETTPYGKEREFTFELPGSGRTVRFVYLDGHKEKRLAALKEPSISSAMLIRLIDVDGSGPEQEADERDDPRGPQRPAPGDGAPRCRHRHHGRGRLRGLQRAASAPAWRPSRVFCSPEFACKPTPSSSPTAGSTGVIPNPARCRFASATSSWRRWSGSLILSAASNWSGHERERRSRTRRHRLDEGRVLAERGPRRSRPCSSLDSDGGRLLASA